MPGISQNFNDPVEKQYLGVIRLFFKMGIMEMVNKKMP
jgi:hypothetical protein